MSINDTVQVSDINVSCTYDGVVTNKVYPELTAQANAGTFTDESGAYHSTGPTASTFDIYVGPSKYAHTYVSGGKVYKGQAFLTPTDATYDPATGVMVVTVGSHSLTTSDVIWIKPYGITFTCAQDNNATLHPYPRSKDPNYGKPIPITAVGATTITVNVGV